MKALRLPVHAFLFPYGFGRRSHTRLPYSCSPRRSRWACRTLIGPGSVVNRRLLFRRASRVDANGISQVPWRSIPCLCPAPRPRPSRQNLAVGGPDDAAPSSATLKASACKQYRGYHAASASAVYASRTTLPSPMQDSLPAGGLRLCREGVEPSGSLRKVSGSTFHSPSQGFA